MTVLSLLRTVMTPILIVAAAMFMVDLWRRVHIRIMVRATYPIPSLLCRGPGVHWLQFGDLFPVRFHIFRSRAFAARACHGNHHECHSQFSLQSAHSCLLWCVLYLLARHGPPRQTPHQTPTPDLTPKVRMTTTHTTPDPLDADIPCMECGYNLRTATPHRQLPGMQHRCRRVRRGLEPPAKLRPPSPRRLCLGSWPWRLFGMLLIIARLQSTWWPTFDPGATTLGGIFGRLRHPHSPGGPPGHPRQPLVPRLACLPARRHRPRGRSRRRCHTRFFPQRHRPGQSFAGHCHVDPPSPAGVAVGVSALGRRAVHGRPLAARPSVRIMVRVTYCCLLVCGTIQAFIAFIWTILPA